MKNSPLYTFYSWNGKLKNEEIKSQMLGFSERGITGVFLHARAGLETEYFSEEWFNAFSFAVETAKQLKMEVGIYDENGWPSGFGNGRVNGLGKKYCQKKLVVSEVYPEGENTELLCCYKKCGDKYVQCGRREGQLFAYAEINPAYVDLLSPIVTEAFINSTHEVYREKFGKEFGKTIKYLFTDEPQLAAPYAYTDNIEEIFMSEYGYDMRAELWRLISDPDSFCKFRYDYRRLIYRLFHTNYTKRIAEWCGRYSLKMTGHFACEENTVTLNLNGGVMNGYRYMQAPGVDAIGRRRPPAQLFEQLVSAKNIFGKGDVLSETFGCSGWGTTLSEFRYLWANQAVRGVTVPCLHLSAYSMQGIRKRDYPAFFSYQEPWWDDFGGLAGFMKKTGGLVNQERYSDVLVLFAECSALGLAPECETDKRLSESYSALVKSLSANQIAFDIINDSLFEMYAEVGEGKIKLKGRQYSVLILSSGVYFTPECLRIVKEAAKSGVKTAMADDFYGILPENADAVSSSAESVADFFNKAGYVRTAAVFGRDRKPDPDFVARRFGDCFAFFNSDAEAVKKVTIYAEGARALKICDFSGSKDYVTELKNGFKDFEFEPGQLIIAKKCSGKGRRVSFKTEFLRAYDIKRCDLNALTLDMAEYSLDGVNFSETEPVIDIEERLAKNRVRRAVVRYRFYADFLPPDMKLAAERGAGEIKVNGKKAELTDEWFVDRSILTVPIAKMAVKGENTVEILYSTDSGLIRSSEDLDDKNEIKRNLFSYDLEIENIYVLGSFGIKVNEYSLSKNLLYVFDNSFRITEPEDLKSSDLTPQGLWFYRGKIKARIKIPLLKTGERAYIKLAGGEQCSAKLEYRGKTVGVLTSDYSEIEVSGYSGRKATLIISISNRNLLGPHHHVTGEPAVVGGNTFRGVRGFEDEWLESRHLKITRTEGYCFRRNAFPEIKLITKKTDR